MKRTKNKSSSAMTKAKKSLLELQEKFSQFVKPRKYKRVSTIGRWRDASESPPHPDKNCQPLVHNFD